MEPSAPPMPPEPCPRCGEAMHPATVKTAIWQGDRLFLVEDIPAQVCDSCMDQFYDEETADTLRRLTEEGFSSVKPQRETVVPIFSLQGRIRRRECPDDDVFVDG